MGERLQVREVTDEERQAVKRLAHSRTAPARAVERAQGAVGCTRYVPGQFGRLPPS